MMCMHGIEEWLRTLPCLASAANVLWLGGGSPKLAAYVCAAYKTKQELDPSQS